MRMVLRVVCAVGVLLTWPATAKEAKTERVTCGEDFVTVVWIQDLGGRGVTIRKKDVIRVATAKNKHVAGLVVNWTKPDGVLTVWVAIEDFWAIVKCLD